MNKFASKLGVVMAAAGSAVGLGNVWRFPYLAGENGGGAFLLVYLVCIVLIGLPIVLSEFVLGRRSGMNVAGAMRTLSGGHRWDWLGWMCIGCCVLMMSFYIVITGWCVEYIWLALTNRFSSLAPEQMSEVFAAFQQSAWRPVLCTMIALGLNVGIIALGVQKGIERISTWLMPILLVILMLLCVRSLTLPGSGEGLRFLFQPDFSKITPAVYLAAGSQAFFTLSIGLGCMLTYAAYMRKDQNLIATAGQVVGIDTLVAIVAGIAIFPAVFALGFSPAEGPKLVFMVLPSVFSHMPGGYIFAILFFVLLFIAAITSSISIQEVAVAYCEEEHHMPRKRAIILTTAIIVVLSALCSLSISDVIPTICHKTVFDWFDYLTSKFMMPIGGFCFAVFLGWFYPKQHIQDELATGSHMKHWFFQAYLWTIRIIVPIAVVIIFVNGLIN